LINLDYCIYEGYNSSKSLESHKMIKNNQDIKDIFRHLEDCLDFQYLNKNLERLTVECSCGTSWQVVDLHSDDLDKFIQYANMFPHSIRGTAKRNNVPIEDIIIPLLGMCVNDIEFEEIKLEEPDVELF